MNLLLFRNTYGKLALFYLVISFMMFYLAYDFVHKQLLIEEFYREWNYAENLGESVEERREEAPLQEGKHPL